VAKKEFKNMSKDKGKDKDMDMEEVLRIFSNSFSEEIEVEDMDTINKKKKRKEHHRLLRLMSFI
jgi:hypothetical protein